MTRLNGKTAVITGGATGIGFAAARRFIDEGAFVFIFGRRQDALDAALARLGPNARAVKGSVSDLADLEDTRMRDYADDIGIAVRQIGRPPVIIGWGMGALAALLYAQSRPVLGLVLLAPSPPAAALPRRPADHELKSVPPVYDAEWWGWRAHIWMNVPSEHSAVMKLSRMPRSTSAARSPRARTGTRSPPRRSNDNRIVAALAPSSRLVHTCSPWPERWRCSSAAAIPWTASMPAP